MRIALQDRLWITQHGDAFDDAVVAGFSDADRNALWAMAGAAQLGMARQAIIICHSEPGTRA